MGTLGVEMICYNKLRLRYICSYYLFGIKFLGRLFARPLLRNYLTCLFCHLEVGVVSYHCAGCRHHRHKLRHNC